jgi:hypothetical protein
LLRTPQNSKSICFCQIHMKTIIEGIEIKKTTFSKGIFIALAALSLLAFLITINEPGNKKWICLFGALFFGAGYLMVLKAKIRAAYDDVTVYDIRKEKFVPWKEITSLDYHSVYHGHGTELRLTILYGSPTKRIDLPVKQFNKEKMQRFFEVLNEQCPGAIKNIHFIKQATGEMSWKDKLKMY